MKTDWKTFLTDAGAEYEGDIVMHFGNPVREQRVALSGPVFADLSHLGVIAVYGTDAESFLQGQLSNDCSRVDRHHSQLSAYCNPKGRILGLFRVFRNDDTFYLRLPLDTLEPVLQRLRMFVLRADVTLEDASDNFIRIGIAGEDAVDELIATTGAVPETVNQAQHTEHLTIIRVPGVQPRFEVYADSVGSASSLWDALNVRGAPVGISTWGMLEILAGLPSIHSQTTGQFVPQMVNLQLIDGVDFNKGCYPGQEIVARTKYLGKLKRRMYLGRLASDDQPQPGDELFSATDSEQAAGRIVDAQPHPDGGFVTLAVVQIKAIQSDSVRLGNSKGPEFTLQSLPYDFDE